ncbi:MAG: PSD1 and planctomycete cytochrome C domain-containing protein [Planctomycetota bacterium]
MRRPRPAIRPRHQACHQVRSYPTIRKLAAGLLALACASLATSLATAADTPISYEEHIRPLFKAHCFYCHGEGGKKEGGLDLRLRRLALAGGESGAAITPGDANASRLFQRVRDGEMPPKSKLSAAELQLLERWISAGAPARAAEPADPAAVGDITDLERSYWAFQPIRRHSVPTVRHSADVRTPIDAFLLEKLEARELRFSPPADPTTRLRRLAFNLTGLPPTADDLADFAEPAATARAGTASPNDSSPGHDAPDAWSRAVDRWLASPRYGERWGRHWLDAAGYADSEGYTETDPVRPYAYKYRDYVIRSFNSDRPLDTFIVEQLAGDELVPLPRANLSEDDRERLIATGFLRTAPDGTASGVAPKEAGNAVVAETIKVVSTSLLGMTVGCAQCHNHRYDPIPQTDYFRMRAIFEPAMDWKRWRPPAQRLVSLATDADRTRSAEIEAEARLLEGQRQAKQLEYIQRTADRQLGRIPIDRVDAARLARDTLAAKRTPEQQQLIKEFPSVNVDAGSLYLYDSAAAADLKKEAERIEAFRATKPVEDFISCLTEVPGHLPTTQLHERGDPDFPKQELPPGDLSVVSTAPFPAKDPASPTSGRRLAFAKHLTSGQHPLVGRVLANRFWMHHFGRGIVATAGDFGKLGAPPTHPELLDWLAEQLAIDRGWSLKRWQREIVLSTAYQQSSSRRDDAESRDPDNQLWSRMSVRRLEAEAIRDAILAVNGSLNLKAHGPAIPVMEDDVGQIVIGIENKNGENRPGPIIPMHGDDYRRSVFVQVRRSRPLGVLDAFDLPTLEPNCTGRAQSTVAPQALMLMNSEFLLEQAGVLADQLLRDAGPDPAAQTRRGFERVFGRSPTDRELTRTVAFLARQTAAYSTKRLETAANGAAGTAGAAGNPAAPATPADERLALASFCQALLSSSEFLYVD